MMMKKKKKGGKENPLKDLGVRGEPMSILDGAA